MKLKGHIEYDIYIPTTDLQGHSYQEAIVLEAKRNLVEFFGGLTNSRFRNEGIWRLGEVTVRDEVVMWRIVSQKGRAGDIFIGDIKVSLEEALHQEQIFVVRRRVQVIQ